MWAQKIANHPENEKLYTQKLLRAEHTRGRNGLFPVTLISNHAKKKRKHKFLNAQQTKLK